VQRSKTQDPVPEAFRGGIAAMHSLDNCCKKKSHLSCKSFEVHGQGGNWTCTVCLPSFSQDWLFWTVVAADFEAVLPLPQLEDSAESRHSSMPS
jgi:hypothetical protein